jgi:pimeloyl-ACP methyl ester carboxylesterase
MPEGARRPPAARFAVPHSVVFPALACALLGAFAAPAAAPAGSAAGASWQFGALELKPCEIGATSSHGIPSQAAWCTDFAVPEDWDRPGERQIRLRVALVRALGAETDADLLVFLDGGPGGAATQDYPAVAGALAPLRQRRHVLLVDQRGTGDSHPLDCGEPPDTDEPAHAASGAAGAAARVERVRACAAHLAPHTDPRLYATTDAVRDLEAVRIALGGPALDLVGVSYGTRVAQQYARRYPQAVRSMVLDSAVPNDLVLLSEHARNLEDAVRARLEACRADPECGRRYGDSYAVLKQVQARLRREPRTVEIHDPQSFALVRRTLGSEELATLVRFYAYGAATSALLPYVIAEAQAGRYGPLLSQAQLVLGDVAERLNGGLSASVLCTEDADLLRDQPQDAGTLLGPDLPAEVRRACAAWPHRARPADFHEPFRGAMPVLVLAGELDPVTPPRYGERIVGGLPRARLLVAPGQGHAVIGAGCLPRLVDRFIEHLDPEHLDERCLARLGPAPFFLDVNGPAP